MNQDSHVAAWLEHCARAAGNPNRFVWYVPGIYLDRSSGKLVRARGG